ncbi:MAG: DUF6491 family protein [Woeseiaceae bacterium]|nr:DUF6491 family protein [Woeseiaceae bacterium]
MQMNFGISGMFACTLTMLMPVGNLLADEPQDDDAGESCILLQRIDRTEILDNQNILFYMRGGDIYLNRLRNRCPGLRRNEPIMYNTTSSQLCDLDRISVLYNRGGGLSPGASCRLGRFLPISEEDVEALKAEPPAPEIKPVPGAQPEEIERPDEQ